jgi:hypothetical protein
MEDSLLSISFDSEGNAFLNRQLNGEFVQSVKITKHEALTILIPAMADNPDFAERMMTELQRLNIARPNHSI